MINLIVNLSDDLNLLQNLQEFQSFYSVLQILILHQGSNTKTQLYPNSVNYNNILLYTFFLQI